MATDDIRGWRWKEREKTRNERDRRLTEVTEEDDGGLGLFVDDALGHFDLICPLADLHANELATLGTRDDAQVIIVRTDGVHKMAGLPILDAEERSDTCEGLM